MALSHSKLLSLKITKVGELLKLNPAFSTIPYILLPYFIIAYMCGSFEVPRCTAFVLVKDESLKVNLWTCELLLLEK